LCLLVRLFFTLFCASLAEMYTHLTRSEILFMRLRGSTRVWSELLHKHIINNIYFHYSSYRKENSDGEEDICFGRDKMFRSIRV